MTLFIRRVQGQAMYRKPLLSIAIVLVVALSFIYYAGIGYIESYSREGLQTAMQYLQRRGLGSGRVSFENVQYSSPRSLLWKNLRGTLNVRTGKDVIELFVSAGEIEIWLESIRFDQYRLEVRNFSFRPNRIIERGDDEARAERVKQKLQKSAFQGNIFRLNFTMNPLEPEKALENIVSELIELTKGEAAMLDAEMSASLSLILGDSPLRGRLALIPKGQGVVVSLDENDVRTFARKAKDQLTEGEVRIVAQNPFRAGELMSIKGYAVRKAIELSKKDPQLPQDAYRHVLWSYLLTKRFNAEFAKRVTDAHEEKKEVKDYFDKEMDLINNRIGRRFAQNNYSEEELAHLVKTDPGVVHSISNEEK